MPVIVFPGSFNPFTIGHKSLVERALPLCERLIIAIGQNAEKGKDTDDISRRVKHISELFAHESKVEVMSYSGLTVDFCKEMHADWMLRGVRSVADFEYERNIADINRRIAGIETLLLFSLPEDSAISSSIVRELQQYGYDCSQFLP